MGSSGESQSSHMSTSTTSSKENKGRFYSSCCLQNILCKIAPSSLGCTQIFYLKIWSFLKYKRAFLYPEKKKAIAGTTELSYANLRQQSSRSHNQAVKSKSSDGAALQQVISRSSAGRQQNNVAPCDQQQYVNTQVQSTSMRPGFFHFSLLQRPYGDYPQL